MGHPSPKILADQLTQSEPGGHIMLITSLLAPHPPDFQTFLRPCNARLFSGNHLHLSCVTSPIVEFMQNKLVNVMQEKYTCSMVLCT